MSADSPFSAGSIQKAVHATLDDAYAAIPAGHSHAVIFDGTASTAAGAGVRGMFVQRVGTGWNIVIEGDATSRGGVAGKAVVTKSW